MKSGLKFNQFSSLRERFIAQHGKSDNGCWEWIGHISTVGYGQIKDRYKTRMAHRVSWELHRGEIPSGLCVCHHCDNRKCVNPDHLFLGTNAENTRDAVSKGRHAFGERQSKAKLTWEIVNSIRSSTEDARVIAKRLGVAFSTIYRVRSGFNWKRVGNV